MLLFNKKCSNCQSYYDPTLNECPKCHKANELAQNRDVSNDIVFFHPFAQIGLFLGGFSYVGMLLCQLICSLFFGGISDVGLKNALIILFCYLLMLGGLLSISLFTRRQTFIKKFTHPSSYLYGLAYAGMMVLAALLIGVIVSIFYFAEENTNQNAAVDIVNNYPILAFFVIVIIGPICEEMTYRVGLYSFLRRINVFLAFAITSIVFALIHFDFEASNMANELSSLPTYLACGFLLSLAYERHGPACSITAHMLYNLTAFLVMVMNK